jgi:hypothetical protein
MWWGSLFTNLKRKRQMKHLLATAAAIVLLATPAVAAPPPFINGQPVSVDVTNPSEIGTATAKALTQQPIAFPLTVSPNTGAGTPFIVPANKRLVIEYGGGSCQVNSANISRVNIATSLNGSDQTLFAVNFQPIASPALNQVVTGNFGHLVKIYVEAGFQVDLDFSYSRNGGFVFCDATLSGQLVDVP